jgi:hypothetical protein
MKLRKGDRIHFLKRDEIEIVEKGSSDPVMGEIKTDKNEYSMDFIARWESFGFLKILPKNEKGKK